MPEVAHDINCAFYEGKHLLMLLLLAKTCAVVFFRDGFEKKPLGLVRELDNVLVRSNTLQRHIARARHINSDFAAAISREKKSLKKV